MSDSRVQLVCIFNFQKIQIIRDRIRCIKFLKSDECEYMNVRVIRSASQLKFIHNFQRRWWSLFAFRFIGAESCLFSVPSIGSAGRRAPNGQWYPVIYELKQSYTFHPFAGALIPLIVCALKRNKRIIREVIRFLNVLRCVSASVLVSAGHSWPRCCVI